MPDAIQMLSNIIRKRRAVYAKAYVPEKEIGRESIEIILENAIWAPTHKRTEPWRFLVFHSKESRVKLSEYLGAYFLENTPHDQFSEEKYEKFRQNPLRAGCVIVIVMRRDPDKRVPEWEEVAAVACAVQNMWLTAAALGLGCYWSTASAILNASAFLGLGAGERCLGMLYLGHHEMPEMDGKRLPVSEMARWL